MENQNAPQLELFSKQAAYGASKTQERRGSFFGRVRSYEKVLLLIIGFITVSIISFSLGVEKGKTIVSSNALFERASLGSPGQENTPAVYEKQEAPLDSQVSTVVAVPVKKDITAKLKTGKGYTVQLASYKTNSYAQKEGEFLKRKGLSPVYLNKGNYVVLCVGNFSDRNAAESLLSELKKEKRYSGCLIRRL